MATSKALTRSKSPLNIGSGNELDYTWPVSQRSPIASTKRKGANVGQIERIASLGGGGTLVWLGLQAQKNEGPNWWLVGLGGLLFWRGLTRHSLVYQALGVNRQGKNGAVRIERTGTIGKPAEELYNFWRDFRNLPRFMEHLESVTVQDDKHSHWVAKAPLGTRVEWDAEITEDVPNQVIAWKTVGKSQVQNAGRVTFEPAPGDRGTRVKVVIDYQPPAGSLGVAIAKFTGEEPTEQVREDLRHFKMLMETGQVITTKGQPSCRKK